MQNTQHTTPTTPSQHPVSTGTPAPKSAPIPVAADLLKHIGGAGPTRGW